jgi:hypothetical protein
MFRVGFIIFVFLFCSSTAFSKTLTIIAAADRGVPFNNVKLLSNYVNKYDSTITSVVIKVVPGAGGINAANYIYNIANKDGYTIGTFQKAVLLKGLIARKNIKYNISNFTWLGSSSDGRIDSTILAVNKPYGGFLNVGELNPNGSIVNLIPRLTGWNIKMIAGYPNKPAMKLAFKRKEIDGYLVSIYAHPDRNNILAAFQINRYRSPLLKNVSTLRELTVQNNEILDIIEYSTILLRPFVAPPNIPETRKMQLRKMFNSIMLDKDYVAKGETLQINVSLVDWKESIDIINKMKNTDKKLIKELVSSNPR